jgi:hypothetical protein
MMNELSDYCIIPISSSYVRLVFSPEKHSATTDWNPGTASMRNQFGKLVSLCG